MTRLLFVTFKMWIKGWFCEYTSSPPLSRPQVLIFFKETKSTLGVKSWIWEPLMYRIGAAFFIKGCAIVLKWTRSAYEGCALTERFTWKVIYSVLFVNPIGTQKNWLRYKQACALVCSLNQWAEIREGHYSLTLKCGNNSAKNWNAYASSAFF